MIFFILACASEPSPAPSATTPPPPTQQLKTIKMALNWYPEPEFGGFYDAAITGKYKAKQIEVNLIPGGPGAPVLEQLLSGQADAVVTGADDLLIRRSKGMDAVAIFPGFQDTPLGLMTHKGGPSSFEEIHGRVAIEQGSPFQLFVSKKYNWDKGVEMVPTTGSIGTFAADPALTQQGYITSEPCQAAAQNIETGFLAARLAGWNPYGSMIVVRGSDIDARWVKDLRDASLEGWNAYLADPKPANAEISRLNPGMPSNLMDCVVERQKPYVVGTDGVGKMTDERWAEIAAAMNSVGQTVDPKGAWKILP